MAHHPCMYLCVSRRPWAFEPLRVSPRALTSVRSGWILAEVRPAPRGRGDGEKMAAVLCETFMPDAESAHLIWMHFCERGPPEGVFPTAI